MPQHPTDADIEEVNREILARRAEAKPPAPRPQPADEARPADISSMVKNDFRGGMPALDATAVAEMVETWRAGYSRFALDPNGEEIIRGLETKLAAALAADGVKLPPLSSTERLRALRVAAAMRANDIR
jgi:hypothetical protein